MVFWVSAALIVAVSLFVLLRALSTPTPAEGAGQGDIAFYHSQQAEILRQRAAGMIDDAEAKAAEAEAARKLLVRTRESVAAPVVDVSRGRIAQALIALAIPVVALGVYFKIGAPEMPDMPMDQRVDISKTDKDLARLVDRLEEHLAEAPDDAQGYELALPVYMRMGRYESAVGAAERLLALKGPSAERFAMLAEAQIFAGQGLVGDEARKAIASALELAPKLARARFYSGLAAEQAGDADAALKIWREMEAELPDGGEKRAVASQIARLAPKAGPTGEAAEAIRAMPQADQAQAIRGMVDSLEARLKSGGGSIDEWQKLLRALNVLGDKDRVIVALKLAREKLAGDAQALETLGKVAVDLALEKEKQP